MLIDSEFMLYMGGHMFLFMIGGAAAIALATLLHAFYEDDDDDHA